MRSRRALYNQEGATLVELLITLVILGIAFLVILGGMTNAIVLSDLHRRQSRAETILREFAEVIKTTNYIPCADDNAYDGVYTYPATTPPNPPLPPDPDFVASVTRVRVWSGSDFEQGCSVGPDKNIQLVTLRVTLSENRGYEEVSVIKRRPI